MRLGVLLLKLGRTSESIDVLRTAVSLAEGNAMYNCLLADAYLKEGMDQDALRHYMAAGVLDDYDSVNLKIFRGLVEQEYPGRPAADPRSSH